MAAEYEDRVRSLSAAKALAIAAYGESVAAYRYRTLADRTSSAKRRVVFTRIADEEQTHHKLVQDLMRSHFPGSDFVLMEEDKELVIVGPRMLDVADDASLVDAFDLMYQSERRTGQFYATLHAITTMDELKPLLGEMARECESHAERIQALPAAD